MSKIGMKVEAWLELDYKKAGHSGIITEKLFIKMESESGEDVHKFKQEFDVLGKDHFDVMAALRKLQPSIAREEIERIERLEGEKLARFKREFERDPSVVSKCVKHKLI